MHIFNVVCILYGNVNTDCVFKLSICVTSNLQNLKNENYDNLNTHNLCVFKRLQKTIICFLKELFIKKHNVKGLHLLEQNSEF